MYYYFVSFSVLRGNQLGFGSCEVSMTRPIRSIEDLTNFKKRIEAELSLESIVILNFSLLRRERFLRVRALLVRIGRLLAARS